MVSSQFHCRLRKANMLSEQTKFTLIELKLTLVDSTVFVTMTIILVFSCHAMYHRSLTVNLVGP